MGALFATRLKELLHYDAVQGKFYWKAKSAPQSHVKIGQEAGTLRKDGRVQINLEGKVYLASRLAWIWMTGDWPDKQVDHKDCNPGNNAWCNLRLATPIQNSANQGIRKNNNTGMKGVSIRKKSGKFLARMRIGEQRLYLGDFDCPAAAHFAVMVAALKHNGEFARLA